MQNRNDAPKRLNVDAPTCVFASVDAIESGHFFTFEGDRGPAEELGDVDPVAEVVDDVGGLVGTSKACGDLDDVIAAIGEVGDVAYLELHEVAQQDVVPLATCHVALDHCHAFVAVTIVWQVEDVEFLAILRTCAQCDVVALVLADQHHVAYLALGEIAEGHHGIAGTCEVDHAIV